MKPATIQWLLANTKPGSVILSRQPFASELPLFTENKLYWSPMAGQHVVTDAEYFLRLQENNQWTPQAELHFRADYYLGAAGECEAGSLYKNEKEDACVTRIDAR
jgi:hypothetical protein